MTKKLDKNQMAIVIVVGLAVVVGAFIVMNNGVGDEAIAGEASKFARAAAPSGKGVVTGCGDGIVDRRNREQCDDGRGENGIACTAGYGRSCTYCSNDCRTVTVRGPLCGDRLVNGGEQCDDGNLVRGDGCDACKWECQFEPKLQIGEEALLRYHNMTLLDLDSSVASVKIIGQITQTDSVPLNKVRVINGVSVKTIDILYQAYAGGLKQATFCVNE